MRAGSGRSTEVAIREPLEHPAGDVQQGGEVEVAVTPAERGGRHGGRIAERRRQRLPVEAGADVAGPPLAGGHRLEGDHPERAQRPDQAGQRLGQVVGEQVLEQRARGLGQEGGAIHAGGRLVQVLERRVDRADRLQHRHRVGDLGLVGKGLRGSRRVARRGADRRVGAGHGRRGPAEPAHRGREARVVGQDRLERCDGDGQLLRDHRQGAARLAQVGYRYLSALSTAPCLVGSIVSTSV